MAEAIEPKKNKKGVTLFKIAGIQITLDYSWFIIFALVIWSLSAGYFPQIYPGQSSSAYWLAGLTATLLFFVSILAHELSHSLMAIRSGIQIPEITLFVFGGMAHLSKDAKNPKTEFAIAIVGPLMSFALAAIFWGLKRSLEGILPTLPVVILEYLAWINLALGVFNLFPGFPLDGGRVFRAWWWWKTGSLHQATKVAADMGKGFAFTLIIIGALQIFGGALIGGLWLIFIGMFLRGMAESGYQDLVMKQVLEDVPARDVMVREVISVQPELPLTRVIPEYFLRYGYRGFPVAQNGQALGVISLADVRAVPEEERSTTTVKQVMAPINGKIQITPDTSLAEALQKMAREEVSRLLVMHEGKLTGLLTRTGLFRFLEMKQTLKGVA
jgi:Zn-dependent protease